ncbi:hypothetical protein HDU85_001577 [Gaertneriomyces sp. JEL0708]|nr:hypothetical protein HDU85_001577 [Gaertneriomyces sp. JEL0708]
MATGSMLKVTAMFFSGSVKIMNTHAESNRKGLDPAYDAAILSLQVGRMPHRPVTEKSNPITNERGEGTNRHCLDHNSGDFVRMVGRSNSPQRTRSFPGHKCLDCVKDITGSSTTMGAPQGGPSQLRNLVNVGCSFGKSENNQHVERVTNTGYQPSWPTRACQSHRTLPPPTYTYHHSQPLPSERNFAHQMQLYQRQYHHQFAPDHLPTQYMIEHASPSASLSPQLMHAALPAESHLFGSQVAGLSNEDVQAGEALMRLGGRGFPPRSSENHYFRSDKHVYVMEKPGLQADADASSSTRTTDNWSVQHADMETTSRKAIVRGQTDGDAGSDADSGHLLIADFDPEAESFLHALTSEVGPGFTYGLEAYHYGSMLPHDVLGAGGMASTREEEVGNTLIKTCDSGHEQVPTTVETHLPNPWPGKQLNYTTGVQLTEQGEDKHQVSLHDLGQAMTFSNSRRSNSEDDADGSASEELSDCELLYPSQQPIKTEAPVPSQNSEVQVIIQPTLEDEDTGSLFSDSSSGTCDDDEKPALKAGTWLSSPIYTITEGDTFLSLIQSVLTDRPTTAYSRVDGQIKMLWQKMTGMGLDGTDIVNAALIRSARQSTPNVDVSDHDQESFQTDSSSYYDSGDDSTDDNYRPYKKRLGATTVTRYQTRSATRRSRTDSTETASPSPTLKHFRGTRAPIASATLHPNSLSLSIPRALRRDKTFDFLKKPAVKPETGDDAGPAVKKEPGVKPDGQAGRKSKSR